ncbi:MAG: CoA transferase, partial [Acidimicrobiales bacterium]
INEFIGSFTTAEIVDRMAINEIPCAPVLDRDEAILDAQVAHNETLVEWDHPTLGRVRQPRPAVHFSATPSLIRTFIGTTGEHTDEVLAEFGHDAESIAHLRDRGLIA